MVSRRGEKKFPSGCAGRSFSARSIRSGQTAKITPSYNRGDDQQANADEVRPRCGFAQLLSEGKVHHHTHFVIRIDIRFEIAGTSGPHLRTLLIL